MAQAAHGSAPDIAGNNVANPLSLILSVAMLLAWYGRRIKAKPFQVAAAAIEKSVEAAIAAKESTPDIGGRLGTRETGDAVAARVQAQK
jgi:3-isopropylmalate dehydrogenase